MSRPNIIILGGGIAGLLAAFAFRHLKPTIIESSGKLGGNFTAGGLKYIHHTAPMAALLRFLGFQVEPYTPFGVLNWDGRFIDYPSDFLKMDPADRRTIQVAHWTKTRGTIKGFRDDCMNDPAGEHGALRVDHEMLIARLVAAIKDSGCEVRLGSRARSIGLGIHDSMPTQSAVLLAEGASECAIAYDVLIPTLPLGVLGELAPWAGLPNAPLSKLNVCEFEVPFDGPRIDGWRAHWDYMYTPGARWISRITKFDHAISVEMPWDGWDDQKAAERMAFDLQLIFGRPVDQHGQMRIIPGHLYPLPVDNIRWPDDWHPLGRFAEWDPRATVDKVYARALALAAKIGHGHRNTLG